MTLHVVLVTGSRAATDPGLVHHVLDRVHTARPVDVVLHGDCLFRGARGKVGVDQHADAWAIARSVHVARVPALWDAFGAAAGPRRNAILVALAPTIALAFPGGRGTADCRRQAIDAGVETFDVALDGAITRARP